MKQESIWIVAEELLGELPEVILELLGEGRKLADKLGARLCAILLGTDVARFDHILAQYGADEVYAVQHPLLSQYSSDPQTMALEALVKEHAPLLLILGATPNGNDLAARVATRLRIGLLTNCTQLEISNNNELEVTKPIYGGKFYATIVCNSRPAIATIQPGVIGVARPNGSRQAVVTTIEPKLDPGACRLKVTNVFKARASALSISETDIVVSGGRGIGGVDKWSVIEELADALGGGIGGSRVAMDMGCITRERLVGQSGNIIAPELYVAAGISGATQHLAGVKEAKRTITINTDQYAAINKSADLVINADVHEVVPAIVRELRKLRAGTRHG
ncbi:MAG: electron transfer flavoprotein subunit alpha/FixB family protein [Chloroflexota bacterium]|nr:MAG: electron transfer flavoprotein subunit alpha/FixB family protein [Chloroflexota bacterium]